MAAATTISGETLAKEALAKLSQLKDATEEDSTVRCTWDKATDEPGVPYKMTKQCSVPALIWPETGQSATNPPLCYTHTEKIIMRDVRKITAKTLTGDAMPRLSIGRGFVESSGFGVSLKDALRVNKMKDTVCQIDDATRSRGVIQADNPDAAICIALDLHPKP